MPESEIERIREVYRKRAESGFARLYAPHRSEVIYERAMVDLLIARYLAGFRGSDGMKDCRILDVGCGRGRQLRTFLEWGAKPENLHGIDIFEDDVEDAKHLSASGIRFSLGSAEQMPYSARSFDVIVANTVLSSILNQSIRSGVCREMDRVAGQTGVIFVYDFVYRNPRNPNVKPVGCRELADAFDGWRLESKKITMAPPISRTLGRLGFRCLVLLDAILPVMRSHRLFILRRK